MSSTMCVILHVRCCNYQHIGQLTKGPTHMGFKLLETFSAREGNIEHEHVWSLTSEKGNRQTFGCECGRIEVDRFGHFDDTPDRARLTQVDFRVRS